MKHPFLITFIAFVCATFSILHGQAISPPVSEKFPFQVGILMDGGTFYIIEKQGKNSQEQRHCINHALNSGDKGELFTGNLHPTMEGAKLVEESKARKILDQIEAKLKAFHGAEVLENYRKNPIDLEGMSEQEAEEKIKDPKFNERVATQMLLEEIQKYRESHKAKPGDAAKPAKAGD